MMKVGLLPREATALSTEYLCNKTDINAEIQNIHYLGQLISTNLQNKWNMHIRSMNAACNTGDIYLTVRIRDVNSLGLLLEEAETQHTCNIMQNLIAQLDYNITGRINPTITIDKSDIYNYQNVLLPFQSKYIFQVYKLNFACNASCI
jgi:hypothetical protein